MDSAPAPFFSVVIPAYNRAALLEDTIRTVLAQTYPSFELIVVDDASSDVTAIVLRKISDPRCRPLFLPTRSGAAQARNAGVQSATGDFVAFLDSDDVWAANKLEVMAACVPAAADPGRTLFYHPMHIKDQGPSRINPSRGLAAGENLGDYLLHEGLLIQTSTIVMARALCAEFPFDATLPKHQDWDLTLRLWQGGVAFHFCPEPLASYVSHENIARISSLPDVAASERWCRNQAALSPKAQDAFACAVIAPQWRRAGRPGRAFAILCRVGWRRRVQPKFMAKHFLKVLFPGFYRFLFRALAPH